jgi:hypothetical protein
MIVNYLQDDVRDDFQIHVKLSLRTITKELTPAMFFKVARDKEDLQREISFSSMSTHSSSSYFASVISTTHTSSTRNNHASQSGRSYLRHFTDSRSISRVPFMNGRFRPCLICRRCTHRTIDCYNKNKLMVSSSVVI